VRGAGRTGQAGLKNRASVFTAAKPLVSVVRGNHRFSPMNVDLLDAACCGDLLRRASSLALSIPFGPAARLAGCGVRIQAVWGLPGRCCWPRTVAVALPIPPSGRRCGKRQGVRLPGVLELASARPGDTGFAACLGMPPGRTGAPAVLRTGAGEARDSRADRLPTSST